MKTKHQFLLYLTSLLKHTLRTTAFLGLISVLGAKKRERQNPRLPFISDHLPSSCLKSLTEYLHKIETTLRMMPNARIYTALMYVACKVAINAGCAQSLGATLVWTLPVSAASFRSPIHGHEGKRSGSYLLPEPSSVKATERSASSRRGSFWECIAR